MAGNGGGGGKPTGANVNLFVGNVLSRDDGWLRHRSLDLESLDVATPDRFLLGGPVRGPDIRVAGEAQRFKDMDGLGSLALPPISEAGIEEGWLRQDEGSQGEEAIGELFEANPLTIYACEGDSTGRYCPDGRPTASGVPVYEGMAACDSSRMGQTLEVGGRLVLCGDTGGAIEGNRYHVDVWFYYAEEGFAWLAGVGTETLVEVMR